MFTWHTPVSATLARKVGYCFLPALLGAGAALLLLLAAGGPARTAKAAPATVSYPGCAPTIQECLDSAPVGGSVVISPGTYITSLTLSQAVNLSGVNSATTILQALSGQRVLTVTGVDVDSSVVISGLTFSGGNALGATCPAACGGAIAILNQAEPGLQNLIVISNTAGRAGGGMYVTGPVAVQGSHFENNLCLAGICEGGALYASGALTVTASQFISNAVTDTGGALWSTSAVSLTDVLLQGNTADLGGGLFTSNNAVLVATRFLDNAANGQGGGAEVEGQATIQGGLFQGNTCTGRIIFGLLYACLGGGLRASSVVLTGTMFLSNTATLGWGGGANTIGSMQNVLFQGNQSTHDGGGLYSFGLISLSDAQFLSNTAGQGAGAYVSAAAIQNTRFQGNRSAGNGGALWSSNLAGLTDSHLEDNSCSQPSCLGGGVYAASSLELSNTQILSNSSTGAGGGVYAAGAVTVYTGLFADNQCQSGGCTGGGLRATSTLTLTDTHFLDNHSQSYGGGAYAGGAATVQGALFQDNLCGQAGCSGGGLYAKNGLGLFASQFLDNVAQANGGGLAQVGGAGQVVNSLFARNSTMGGSGEALYLSSPGSVAILHTTVASSGLGSGAAIVVVAGTVGITDTIITSYTTGISQTAGSVLQDYNLFFGNGANTSGAVGGGAHSLVGNPLFVNAVGDDYHLGSGSPAVDTGANAGVTADFEGDPRPRGAGFDIGFDEARSPSAAADAFSLSPNTSLVVAAPGVLANDSTLNAGPLTALWVSGPATGSLVLAPSGAFTYTPPLNFTGQTTFVYRASDGQFLSAPAVVTITVNAFKLYLPLLRK